jgi:hypothetical protein
MSLTSHEAKTILLSPLQLLATLRSIAFPLEPN